MKIVWLVLMVFGFAMGMSPEQQDYLNNKKTITMCVDPDWYPFEDIKNGVHRGIAADLIALVSQKLGLQIMLVPTTTWEQSLGFSKNKICDIMSFLNETPKRKEWLTFTNPIFSDPNVLIGRSDSEFIDDLSAIKASIALPKGTAMGELFARDFPNLTIIPTVTESEAFELVANRKADMTLRSMIISAYTIKQDSIFNLKIIATPQGYENHLRIGVRKDEPILRDILNLGIAQISKEEVDAIVNKYVQIKIEKVTVFSVEFYIFLLVVGFALMIVMWNYTLRKKVAAEVAKNETQQKILFQKAKQAEIGSLVANISHQWRDALGTIGATNAQTVAKIDYGEEISQQQIKKNAEEIEQSIAFMSETMHRFLDFYKNSDTTTLMSVCESIDETLRIVDMKIKQSKLELFVECQEDFKIEAIKNEWMNIWLNIIVNTLNAQQKNNIEVPTLYISITKNTITFKNNCGQIEKDLLYKLQTNAHSGLGLMMSKEILKKYNFELVIENNPTGVTFTIQKTNL